jgi:hypothetical protein
VVRFGDERDKLAFGTRLFSGTRFRHSGHESAVEHVNALKKLAAGALSRSCLEQLSPGHIADAFHV